MTGETVDDEILEVKTNILKEYKRRLTGAAVRSRTEHLLSDENDGYRHVVAENQKCVKRTIYSIRASEFSPEIHTTAGIKQIFTSLFRTLFRGSHLSEADQRHYLQNVPATILVEDNDGYNFCH